MKKFLLIVLGFCGLFTVKTNAQSFVTQADTVWGTAGTGSFQVNDYVTAKVAGGVVINWNVVSSNFPSDWLSGLSICDNYMCRGNGGDSLWNGTTGNAYTSDNYAQNVQADFHLLMDLSAATTTGVYYITVRLNDGAHLYSKNVTFMVAKSPAAVNNISGGNDISLYPNPAHDRINVVFGADAGVHSVAIYNMIGNVMSVYKVAGNSAGIDINSMPAGVYFMRLADGNGNIVATRRFTRQ